MVYVSLYNLKMSCEWDGTSCIDGVWQGCPLPLCLLCTLGVHQSLEESFMPTTCDLAVLGSVCVCLVEMWIFSTPTPLLLVPWLWYWCWVEMWCYGESQVYVNGKVWDLPSMWIDCSHHYHFWHTYTSLTLLALLIHSVPVQCTQHKTIGMVQSTASMHAQLPNPINTSAAAAHPIPVCPHLHSGSSTQSSAFYCCCCILVRHTHSY